jgi:sodium/potassium-transporting ATPase subunit alpha
MMNVHKLSLKELLDQLHSTTDGLSETEALKRVKESGYNRIEEVRKKNLFKIFLSKFTNLLALLLWIALFLCFLSEYLHPGGGLLNLAIAILVVIFINAIFSFFQEYKAERTIDALKKLLPKLIRVIREGKIVEISSEVVVVGDLLLLRAGDKVSADARIIESTNLMVSDALLTGESKSKAKQSNEYEGDFYLSPNLVFAGSFVEGGVGKAIVFATGKNSEVGKIARLTKEVSERPSPLQQEIGRLSKFIAIIALFVGITFFTIGFFFGDSFWKNFLFGIGIIIALVPEGLLPTVSISLAMASFRMAKKNALIKSLPSAEALGSVTVICTDKTGTLTQNKMAVEKLSVFASRKIGEPSHLQILPLSKVIKNNESVEQLMIIARFCNNAFLKEGSYQGDPTDVALIKGSSEIIKKLESTRLIEIPFDSTRKRMSTANKINGKTFLFTKGAVESLLPICTGYLREGKIELFGESQKKEVLDAFFSLMDEGYRIISCAYKEVDEKEIIKNQEIKDFEKKAESDLIFVGLIGLEDAPRPEVPEAIKKCKEAGIKVIMITGDAGRTALSIARQIDLINEGAEVVEGTELDNMSDRELKDKLTLNEIIFARMNPAHKMRVVTLLEEMGERVAVTGDGVNDAPALKKAHIGVAMGVTGTDVAREAADMVLLDDNFASIVKAIEEGRAIFENIRKFVTYIFASNFAELVPYIVYILFSIPLPLTIMQILAIDLGTDMFPALALGAEKPRPGVMQKPPRSLKERLLNFKTLALSYLFLGPIEAAIGLFGFFFVMKCGGWHWGSTLFPNSQIYLQATSACLAGIIIAQIGNIFACRSADESIFKLGFFTNKLVIFGIICDIFLAAFIFYTPLGNFIFQTSPIALNVILVLLPFSLALLLLDELRKIILKKWNIARD